MAGEDGGGGAVVPIGDLPICTTVVFAMRSAPFLAASGPVVTTPINQSTLGKANKSCLCCE